jgi:hypothetical protein
MNLRNNIHINWYLTLCVLMSFAFIFSSFIPNHYQQKTEIKSTETLYKYDLGVSLQPGINSGLISYWLVKHKDGEIMYRSPLTANNFVLQMKGLQRSGGNQVGTNLFDVHEIDSCFYSYYDYPGAFSVSECFRMDDLWVLRHNRNPYCPEGCVLADGMLELGWTSKKAQASTAQMDILAVYGIYNFHDVVFGENMFHLFKDVRDPSWQAAYEAAK